MGEDPGRIREQIAATREQLSENREADEIRTEIQETREQMGETVEALGHKADVKTRVKDSITEKKDAVVEKADSLVHKVTGAVPDGSEVKQGAAKVGEGAQKWASQRKTRSGLRSEGPPSASSPASFSPRPASKTRTSARSPTGHRPCQRNGTGSPRARQASRARNPRKRQGHGHPQRRRTKPECGRRTQGNSPRRRPNRKWQPDLTHPGLGGLPRSPQPSSNSSSAAKRR